MSELRPLKRVRVTQETVGEKPIKILAGEDETVVYSRPTYLRSCSGFFARALSGTWLKESTVKIPDHSEDSVIAFGLWAEKGVVKELESLNSGDLDGLASQFNCLANFWILGDYLESPGFQDAAIDALLINMKQQHQRAGDSMGDSRFLNKACSVIGHFAGDVKKQICQLMVDMLSLGDIEDLINKNVEAVNGTSRPDFESMAAVMHAMIRGLSQDRRESGSKKSCGGERPWKMNICSRYHVHQQSEDCAAREVTNLDP